LITVRSVEQREEQGGLSSPFEKPKGLWLSVDGENDWPSWCRAESFSVESLERRFRIDLRDAESLLWITTADELLDFTKRYSKSIDLGSSLNWCYIDWRTVACNYPGMVIAPYQWPLRHDPRTHWYYGWDCASGCIWDAEVVAHIEEVEVLDE
jgi:hypothetical protein